MRINAIPQANIFSNNVNMANKKTSFEGHIINGNNLRKIGFDCIVTSTVGKTMCACAGVTEPSLFLLNSTLSLFGFSMSGISLFIKNGELLNLNKFIKYVKAQNIEEAANFASQNFKIKDFNVDDLDTANWINEGLTKISNKFGGKTYMPSEIALKYLKIPKSKNSLAAYNDIKDLFWINKAAYANIDNKLQKLFDEIREKDLEKNFCIDLADKDEILERMIYKYKEKPSSFTNPQKLSLYSTLLNRFDILLEINQTYSNPAKTFWLNTHYNEFGLLFHEMGHMMNFKNQSMYSWLMKRILNRKFFKTEVDSMILPLDSKASSGEFIAETIFGLLNGDVYPKEIMALFNKLTNVRIPKE